MQLLHSGFTEISTREAESLAAARAHRSWTYWAEAIQHETDSYWAGTLASEDDGDFDDDDDDDYSGMPLLQDPSDYSTDNDSDADDDMPDLELPVAPAA